MHIKFLRFWLEIVIIFALSKKALDIISTARIKKSACAIIIPTEIMRLCEKQCCMYDSIEWRQKWTNIWRNICETVLFAPPKRELESNRMLWQNQQMIIPKRMARTKKLSLYPRVTWLHLYSFITPRYPTQRSSSQLRYRTCMMWHTMTH